MFTKPGIIARALARKAKSNANPPNQTFFMCVFAYGLIEIFGVKSLVMLWRIYAASKRKKKATLPGV